MNKKKGKKETCERKQLIESKESKKGEEKETKSMLKRKEWNK